MRADAILAINPSPTGTYIYSDVYSLIASCYAIIGGGMRVRDVVDIGLMAVDEASINTNLLTYIEPDTGIADTLTPIKTISSLSGNSNNVPCLYQNIKQNNIVSVETPQYTQTICRSKADIITYQGAASSNYGYYATADSSCSHYNLSFVLPQKLTTQITSVDGFSVHNVSRAVSDDCNFYTFISVPPVVGDTQIMNKGLY